MARKITDHKTHFLTKVRDEWCERLQSYCWIWTAYCDKDGYGNYAINRKTQRANRISYELFKGIIPEGLQVCHYCDNPSCVNPDHLFVGSHQDNVDDKVNKNRQHHPIGELAGQHIIKEYQAIDIIERYASGNYTQQELADVHGISFQQVSKIVTGIRWKHLIRSCKA